MCNCLCERVSLCVCGCMYACVCVCVCVHVCVRVVPNGSFSYDNSYRHIFQRDHIVTMGGRGY